MLDFDREWPGAKIVHLNKNYRSSQDIVAAANHFAECIPESHHRHYVESVADKGTFEKPHYRRYQNEVEEAKAIALSMKKYSEAGYSYKEMAVLTRTNAQLLNFETMLYREGIPYTIIDGMSFIDRKEIKLVLCYLRMIQDCNDDEAFEYIYNRPSRWLSNAFLQEVKNLARKESTSYYRAMFRVGEKNRKYLNGVNNIYGVLKDIQHRKYRSVAEMIQAIRRDLNLDSYVSKDLCDDDDSRIENMNSLERMAENLAYINKFSKEKRTEPNSVQLMTIHKSKGLEFPIVFVAGVNQGMLPHGKNQNPDEEKRLMYVAMTRAEKILNISSTKEYGGKTIDESEFIPCIFG